MARIRAGDRGALLVIDAQVGVLRSAWDAPRVITRIARAVDRARSAGVPVVWVRHADAELIRGSADWQLVPGLVPADSELRIDKHHASAFEDTSLAEALARLASRTS